MTATRLQYSLRDAADLASCSQDTLTKAIHSGHLPAKKLGTQYRVRHEDLTAWIDSLPDAD